MKLIKFTTLFFLFGLMSASFAVDLTQGQITSALIIDWGGRIHTANEQVWHDDDAVLVVDASYINNPNPQTVNLIAGKYYAFTSADALEYYDANKDYSIDEGDPIYPHLSLIYLFGRTGTKIVSLKTAGIRALVFKDYYNAKTQPKDNSPSSVIGKAILSTSTTLNIYQLFINTNYFSTQKTP